MGIRLYDSAWVTLDGIEAPAQVHKDRTNLAAFNVGDYQYDIDGYALPANSGAPKITKIYSLQSAKEAGLLSGYDSSNGYKE